VLFAGEPKKAFGTEDLSVTLPTSYWYLRHFDGEGMQEYVSWYVVEFLLLITLD
jgi:hypothetical protein